MVMKKGHRHRGSVSRAFIRRRKYEEDKEYKEKQRKQGKDNYRRNSEREIARVRNWAKQLTEFANKRCKVCNKLLNYRATSGLCRKHNQNLW